MNKKELGGTLKRLSWIALFFIVAMVIVSMNEKKKSARMTAVEVEIAHLPDGNNLVTKGDIYSLLQQSFETSIDGMPQNLVDVERMEKVLNDDNRILRADVFIGANNKVQISLTQRIPVIRIIDKLGQSYYLDKDGNRVELSDHYTIRVLTATGNIPPHVPDFMELPEHQLYQLFDLGKKILADEFFHPMVEQIYVNNKREYLLIPKLGNQKIRLGKYRNIDIKLENLKIFYQKAIANEGWRKYKTIDLRHKGQIVAEKR